MLSSLTSLFTGSSSVDLSTASTLGTIDNKCCTGPSSGTAPVSCASEGVASAAPASCSTVKEETPPPTTQQPEHANDQKRESNEEEKKQSNSNSSSTLPEYTRRTFVSAVPVILEFQKDAKRLVRWQVGEKHFTTLVGTVTAAHSSYLSELILDHLNDNGKNNITATGPVDIFIDHEPDYFPFILQYLRGSSKFLNELGRDQLKKFYEEVHDYWRIVPLEKALYDHLYPHIDDEFQQRVSSQLEQWMHTICVYLVSWSILSRSLFEKWTSAAGKEQWNELIHAITHHYWLMSIIQLFSGNKPKGSTVEEKQREELHSGASSATIACKLLSLYCSVLLDWVCAAPAFATPVSGEYAKKAEDDNHSASMEDSPKAGAARRRSHSDSDSDNSQPDIEVENRSEAALAEFQKAMAGGSMVRDAVELKAESCASDPTTNQSATSCASDDAINWSEFASCVRDRTTNQSASATSCASDPMASATASATSCCKTRARLDKFRRMMSGLYDRHPRTQSSSSGFDEHVENFEKQQLAQQHVESKAHRDDENLYETPRR